jgi:hypothetical protein
MMPMSAAPEATMSAHSAGTRNRRSKRPLLFPVQHAPHQGNRIQITDRAHSQPGNGIGWIQCPVYQTFNPAPQSGILSEGTPLKTLCALYILIRFWL